MTKVFRQTSDYSKGVFENEILGFTQTHEKCAMKKKEEKMMGTLK